MLASGAFLSQVLDAFLSQALDAFLGQVLNHVLSRVLRQVLRRYFGYYGKLVLLRLPSHWHLILQLAGVEAPGSPRLESA